MKCCLLNLGNLLDPIYGMSHKHLNWHKQQSSDVQQGGQIPWTSFADR